MSKAAKLAGWYNISKVTLYRLKKLGLEMKYGALQGGGKYGLRIVNPNTQHSFPTSERLIVAFLDGYEAALDVLHNRN